MMMDQEDRRRLLELRADYDESDLLPDGFPGHWSDQEIAEYARLERARRLAAILRTA
jgi:hypothetical protein